MCQTKLSGPLTGNEASVTIASVFEGIFVERSMKRTLFLFSIALVLGALIWTIPLPNVRYGLAFGLLWLIPGLAWSSLIPSEALDRPERLTIGLGLNFVITPFITLLLTYLPGPVSRSALLTALIGGTGLPVLLSFLSDRLRCNQESYSKTKSSTNGTSNKIQWRRGNRIWFIVALVIAIGLRVVNLGYAEFEGDEARVMMRSAKALEGDETIIFQHDKGPAQLTMVMPGWRLTGITNEWMSRLPFSWASILGIAAIFLYIRQMGYEHAGGIAACLLAIEGFLVGLGRGMRHHNLVFTLTILALLCLLIYYKRGHTIPIILGAVFFAGAALAHYDAALTLPAGLTFVGARLWHDRYQILRAATPVLLAGILGALLVGMFYVPFYRNPHIETTSRYLFSRIGGQIYNNIESSFKLSAVYNSIYFLAALALMLVGQTANTWKQWGRVGLVVCSLLLAGIGSSVLWPGYWMIQDITVAWAPPAVLLLGALFSPRQPTEIRTLWLWLAIPVMFFLFFVYLPLTHVYTIFPPAVTLAAVGLEDLGRRLAKRSRTALYTLLSGAVIIYALCGIYAVIVFVDHTPEYVRNFPKFKIPVYWTPYEKLPTNVGLYGFPSRSGWKVVGHLIDEKQLNGTYDSNKKPRATAYYTRQSTRLSCASPDMYLVAPNVYDPVSIRWDQIKAEYKPTVVATVEGQTKLTVYGRDPDSSNRTLPVEAYERMFDLNTTPAHVASPRIDQNATRPPEDYVTYEAIIGGFAQLLGYQIDTTYAIPGGYVELTLLWQAQEPAPIDYQVFTHLYDGKTMQGQLDGEPVCDNRPTSQWKAGETIIDPYRIPIKPNAQPGSVPLTIGMYNLATMQRLSVSYLDGTPAGDNIHLTDVVIKTP